MIYGTDLALKRSFQEDLVTDYKRKKLEEELNALLPTDKPVKKPVVRSPGLIKSTGPQISLQKPPAPSTEFTPEKGWSKQMDATEQVLHNKWKPLFTELMNLTARVGEQAREGKADPYKKIEAGRMALRILDLDDQLDEIYQQRDQYKASGHLPEEKPYGEPCIDFKQMPLKLANHQRYVREYKAKMTKNPNDLNMATQLKKHEWFVAYYKKQLNLD